MVAAIDDLGGGSTPELAAEGGHLIESGIATAPTVPLVVDGVVSRGRLFGRLGTGRVTTVSGPAGSGKSFLLRSWIRESGLAQRVAFVAGKGGDRNTQRFWTAVADALRSTSVGSASVGPLTAPDLDGWATMDRLLGDLAALSEPVWLVIDDVHELAGDDAMCQLELMIMRSSPQLRFVLLSRQDLRLNLHRLRLEGQLSEIRAADLVLQRRRSAGAVRGRRRRPVRTGSHPAARALRGLAGWAPAGRVDTGRAPRSGTIRHRVLRQRADRRRLPARRGPRAAARRGPAAAAAHLGPGAGQRRAGRPTDRGQRRAAEPAATRGRGRVRHLAGRWTVLVPLPPAVRRPAARRVAADRTRGAPSPARRRRRVVRRPRMPRWMRSGTPRRRGTGR